MSQTQTQTITGPSEDIALQPLPSSAIHSTKPTSPSALEQRLPSTSVRSPVASLTSTSSPTPHLRLLSCILAFFTAGLNDGCLGPLIPYFFRHYALPPSSAAYIYLAAFSGWLVIALTNNHINTFLGLRGTLALGASLQIAAQALRAWAPPFALLAMSFGVASTGQAVQDSAANAYVAGVGKGAHRWLGAVHASYAVGGMVGGLVSAAVAGVGEGWWARFFYVVLAVGVVNVGLVLWAFWGYGRGEGSGEGEVVEEEGEGAERRSRRATEGLVRAAKSKAVWTLSLFYFFHLGVTLTIGGWVVEFLVTVRDAPLEQFSYVSTGLWGGIALGRLLLAEPTHRFGERKMLLTFTLCALVLEIIFWQVPNAIVNSVMAAMMGFVLAPFFAAVS